MKQLKDIVLERLILSKTKKYLSVEDLLKTKKGNKLGTFSIRNESGDMMYLYYYSLILNGKEVDFDILVLAIGVRANTKLVSEIGGEVNKGIIVNNRMETTVKDVYSAGDCTEGEGTL